MGARYRDWSELVSELVAEIAGWVQFVEDFTALRCVCRSWRAAVSVKDFGSKSGNSAPFPLLMLAMEDDSDERELYSLCKNKVLTRISLPEAKGKRLDNVEFGWLLTEYSRPGKLGLELNLLNPFSHAQIKLPNLSDTSIWEASLSANPSDGPCNFALLVISSESLLTCWRYGDLDWTLIEMTFEVVSIGYHNHIFYAIDYHNNVWSLDPNDNMRMHLTVTIATEPTELADTDHSIYLPNLVESPGGEMLIIYREYKLIETDHLIEVDTSRFVVVRVDVMKREWKTISDLDKDAIFISFNAAFRVKASPGNDSVKPNCIYFTGTHVNRGEIDEDTRVYDIKSQRMGISRLNLNP